MIRNNKGSATVEACFVVPVFLFFAVSMANLIMLMMADAHIHQSLAEAADYMAQYSYLEYKTTQSFLIDEVMINTRLQKYLGDDFNVKHTVQNGKKGIIVTVENDTDNPKVFYAKATYMAKLNLPILKNHFLKLTDEVKQKRFVGYGPEEKSAEYVYVTPERSVYHRTRGCTHLSLQYGAKSGSEKVNYTPCHFCGKKENDRGVIYVSRTTNVFHCNKNCSGLKRTVMRIRKEEAAGLSPCQRCGG